MSEATSALVKVRFSLVTDDEGWPPVASEGVWAEPLGDGADRVDNTPWFVRNLAADDVVIARAGGDGALWAIERAEWSGRRTIRVVPFRDGPLRGDLQAVLDRFAPLGVTGEAVQQYGIVALDIPPDADVSSIKAELLQGETDGRWEFEEGCIDHAWINARAPN